MKRKLLYAAAFLMAISAIFLAAYPFISDYVNTSNIEGQGLVYQDRVNMLNVDEYQKLLTTAHQYNEKLVNFQEIGDPAAEVSHYPENYQNMLRLEDTDVMATIRIPKINVNLPIYHGSDDEILKKGVGHLSSSSLPVGGDSTHCILTGHTGQSNVRLFSDIDRLETGDVFYISVLNETLAYKVSHKEVVLPEETQHLQIHPGEDIVTLVTCTPFGINTHRLLVHGVRVSVEDAQRTLQSVGGSTWDEEYRIAVFRGVALLFGILSLFFICRFIIGCVKKHRHDLSKD